MKVFLAIFGVLALSLICVLSETEEKKIKEALRARICNAKPEYGNCKGRRSLWFFNPKHNRCELFVFSNCGGNRNRFFNEEHCVNFCIEKIHS